MNPIPFNAVVSYLIAIYDKAVVWRCFAAAKRKEKKKKVRTKMNKTRYATFENLKTPAVRVGL
jgi:hypothetical protein